MTKMTIYTKGTFKIVENPAIVEKFLLTEQSAIVRFYCIVLLLLSVFSTFKGCMSVKSVIIAVVQSLVYRKLPVEVSCSSRN